MLCDPLRDVTNSLNVHSLSPSLFNSCHPRNAVQIHSDLLCRRRLVVYPHTSHCRCVPSKVEHATRLTSQSIDYHLQFDFTCCTNSVSSFVFFCTGHYLRLWTRNFCKGWCCGATVAVRCTRTSRSLRFHHFSLPIICI